MHIFALYRGVNTGMTGYFYGSFHSIYAENFFCVAMFEVTFIRAVLV